MYAIRSYYDRIDSSARVAASAALMLSYGLGSIVGPILGSSLMELFRPGAMFLGFAVLLVLLALYIRRRQALMPPLPVAAQEQFVPTLPESQVAAEFVITSYSIHYTKLYETWTSSTTAATTRSWV